MSTRDAARDYLSRGFMPIPVLEGKNPNYRNWQRFTVTQADLPQHFSNGCNIGLLLGEPSGGLVDIDLDCIHAILLAPKFLPKTAMIGGRMHSRNSHYFYRCQEAKTLHWNDPDLGADDKRQMIVELRSTGTQTLVSPSKHPDGDSYEWAFGADFDPATVSFGALRGAVGRLAACALIASRWKEGRRHHLALALSGVLARAGWKTVEIEDFILAAAGVAGDPELKDRRDAIASTVQKIDAGEPTTGIPALASIIGDRVVSKLRDWLDLPGTYWKVEEPQPVAPSPDTDETNIFGQRLDFINQLTDEGFAERFVALHKARIRWCKEWNCWMVFDGKRWVEDAALVHRLVPDVSRYYFSQAAATEVTEKKKEYGNIALRLLSERSLRAILELAKKHVAVEAKLFDADPCLFNAANGTLNVVTGHLQRHNPQDFITRLSPTTYEVDVACNRWTRFLEEIFCEDYDLIKFVQKAAGLSLCGEMEESVLLLCTGDGANGKSTFLEAIAAMMGEDYAKSTSPELLLGRDSREQSHELASLRGIRMVITAESGKGRRLNEAMLKRITGGDTVSARRIYASPEQFKPQFTPWMATNHKPRVVDTSHAIWRRLKQIPFDAHFEGENRDTSLGKKLAAENSGILFWAAQGYREYLNEGLTNPERVSKSLEVYQRECDQIGNFIEQCCELGDHFEVHAGDLYKAYRQWCQDTGELPDSQTSFGRRLTTMNLEATGEGKRRCRSGIRLNLLSATV